MQSESSSRATDNEILAIQGRHMDIYEEKNLNRCEIPAQMDLGAAPGRKSSHGVEIESHSTLTPLKIENMRKSRKTEQNSMKTQIFNVQNKFSLC